MVSRILRVLSYGNYGKMVATQKVNTSCQQLIHNTPAWLWGIDASEMPKIKLKWLVDSRAKSDITTCSL